MQTGCVVQQTRQAERFIEEAIRRATGLEVEHVDDGKVSGRHDAEIVLQDGSRAALEITSLIDPAAAAMTALPSKLPVEGCEGTWMLTYRGAGVDRKAMKANLPALLQRLERQAVVDTDDYQTRMRRISFQVEARVASEADERLWADFSSSAEWSWVRRADVSLRRIQSSVGAGHVYLQSAGYASSVDENLTGLAAMVESWVTEPWWNENVQKLQRSGFDELHLAIYLDPSKTPLPVWFRLTDSDVTEIASPEPAGIEPLTDLWLFTAWRTRVARWSKVSGWSIHEYGDQAAA